jgi:hypothetical protein
MMVSVSSRQAACMQVFRDRVLMVGRMITEWLSEHELIGLGGCSASMC